MRKLVAIGAVAALTVLLSGCNTTGQSGMPAIPELPDAVSDMFKSQDEIAKEEQRYVVSLEKKCRLYDQKACQELADIREGKKKPVRIKDKDVPVTPPPKPLKMTPIH